MRNQSTKDIYIYVLRLEGGKYYVGQSTDPERRFVEHQRGKNASAWTRKYKPIEILKKGKTIFNDPRKAMKVENRITLEYVQEFGWRNVRGGDFTRFDDYTHLISLIKSSRLGNELCPIPINHGIDILNYKRCVYTMELEGGNYFVHSTGKLNLSINDELTGWGSSWTKRFKPVRLLRAVPLQDFEDHMLLHMQELKRAFLEYHYANVRGGNFIEEEEDVHREMVYCAMGLMRELEQ